LGGKQSGYFVELGANNGVSQSNTLLLETFWGWRGTLIEPVGETFLQLIRHRSAKRNHLVRAACVSFEFADSTVKIATSGLMSAPIGVDSDVHDPVEHAKSGLKHTPGRDKVTIEEVPARTLAGILEDAKAPSHIDLLSLDVEGGEIEVLNGLDFDRYSFGTLVIESRSIQRLEKLLNSKGYRLVKKISDRDYLFTPIDQ
jgi:FkbM family methyltransferase